MENQESENSSDGSEFVATDEMLIYAYDDESTINDEEDLDDNEEIDNLKAEGDMPLDELMKLYAQLPEPVSDNEDTDKKSIEDGKEPGKEVTKESADRLRSSQNADNSDDEDNNHSQRTNSRLWCKDLMESSSNYDSEDDGDYIPLVDSKHFANAKTRIGEEFQAVVPAIIQSQTQEPHYFSRRYETLLWCYDISIGEPLADSRPHGHLQQYLQHYGKISGISLLAGGDRDDATALYNLMEHNYDVKESLAYAKFRPVQPSEFPNIMQSWSEDECQEFEKGFETHNKNFHLIREQRLKTRSVSEIVEFYYFWKKTGRYEEFIRWCKRDKKKPTNQITDFVDCLLPENNETRREKYLLGSWRGTRSGEHSSPTDDSQTAQNISKLLGCNSSEASKILEGDWNVSYSAAIADKAGTATGSDDKPPKDASKINSDLQEPGESPAS